MKIQPRSLIGTKFKRCDMDNTIFTIGKCNEFGEYIIYYYNIPDNLKGISVSTPNKERIISLFNIRQWIRI